jgi:hypothetical protein
LVERGSELQFDDYIRRTFRDLARSLRGHPRCLIDPHAISPDGDAAIAEVFRRAALEGMTFIPVMGLSRTIGIPPALEHRGRGLALRVVRAEFEAGNLERAIRVFLARYSLVASDIDLILDLGSVADLVVPGVQALTAQFLAEVPDHSQWRTFTVSACAFPLNMSRVERRSHDRVDRVEWVAWRDGLHGGRARLERLPAYSDACIQHPKGVEGFDPRIMQVSAAIRYTANSSWLLVKGESTRAIRPGVQFPTLAGRLVHGDFRADFRGTAHCAGCRGMQVAADGGSGFGSAAKWRELGTIHHLTTAVEQLAALPAP